MDINIKLNSLYIFVDSMERACNFYEVFFGIRTEKDHPGLFIVGEFRFLLVDFKSINKPYIYGNNCLPSFEVDDINLCIKKLEELKAQIIFPCSKIFNNWVLEFRDSEGNDIEVYSKIQNKCNEKFKGRIIGSNMYNKLVRDKIIQIINNRGENPVYDILDNTKYEKELRKKLIEEANEYYISN
jgi:predicted enzyme related to lactoylglutathione lyase